MSKKKVALVTMMLLLLILPLVGCGSSGKPEAAPLAVGKEATVTAPSYMANDEVNGKKMVELLRAENDPVLAKLMFDKVIDGIDEGAKVKVVSQQGSLVKVNYKGKDIFLWLNHLKQ